MRGFPPQSRFTLVAVLFLVLLWGACSDQTSGPAAPDVLDGPSAPAVTQVDIERMLPNALSLQRRFTNEILATPGVVGTAIALGDDGLPTVVALVEFDGVRIPPRLDDVGVGVLVIGRVSALDWQAGQVDPQAKCGKKNQDPCGGDDPSDPDPPDSSPTGRWDRPVPIGVSTGHPSITAGTIGARVFRVVGTGTSSVVEVFALSNNHVYAAINFGCAGCGLGDAVIQPGTFDGGGQVEGRNDSIGTVVEVELIDFTGACTNQFDAAIAASTTALLGNATPSAGYGTPRSQTMAAALNMKVKKFGRTTGLTKGSVNAVNATVNVNYGDAGVACFTNQIIITPGTFSAGGDSGSLVVVDGKGRRGAADDRKPVGLLFAGSQVATIISPIDSVLARFEVTIDSVTIDGGN